MKTQRKVAPRRKRGMNHSTAQLERDQIARWVDEGGAGPEPDEQALHGARQYRPQVRQGQRTMIAWLGIGAMAIASAAFCKMLFGSAQRHAH